MLTMTTQTIERPLAHLQLEAEFKGSMIAAALRPRKMKNKKLNKKKKEDDFNFKIEETVATPEMIKHLVGDNTPDEEEESPAPVAAKKVESPKQMASKPVEKK